MGELTGFQISHCSKCGKKLRDDFEKRSLKCDRCFHLRARKIVKIKAEDSDNPLLQTSRIKNK